MKLIQGDCLEVMKDLPEGSVDMVLVDPPYGKTIFKWDVVIPFEPMWEQIWRVTKKNAAVIFTAVQPFTSELIISQKKWFKYDLIWQKSKFSNPLSISKQPGKIHEHIVIFYRKQPTYNIQKTYGHKNYRRVGNMPAFYRTMERNVSISSDGSRYPTSIIKTNTYDETYHRTQKPVQLLQWLIRSYSNPNDVVLDFAMGSGSTGVACINENREFIGIELDAEIYKIAEERLNESI